MFLKWLNIGLGGASDRFGVVVEYVWIATNSKNKMHHIVLPKVLRLLKSFGQQGRVFPALALNGLNR